MTSETSPSPLAALRQLGFLTHAGLATALAHRGARDIERQREWIRMARIQVD